MSTLTPAQRKDLRARAHHLDPVVLVGDAGLTDAVMAEVERALASHGLIKVRMAGDDREARGEAMARIVRDTGALPVQIIGKLLVLYRADGDAQAAKAPARPRLGAPRAAGTKDDSARGAAGGVRQRAERNDKAFWDGKAEGRARRAAAGPAGAGQRAARPVRSGPAGFGRRHAAGLGRRQPAGFGSRPPSPGGRLPIGRRRRYDANRCTGSATRRP